MKVELHLHTFPYSPCANDEPEAMLREAVRLGYEAVFLTDHDRVWPARKVEQLRLEFPELLILPGLELTVGLHHLLILGTSDPEYVEMYDFGAIFEKARRDGQLTVLAHPYRWPGACKVLGEGKGLPDAIEYWTGSQQSLRSILAAAAATRADLPLVNSSDAHSAEMLGRYWIETHQPFATAAELRDLLRAGAYDNRMVQQ